MCDGECVIGIGVVWSVHYDNGHRVTICIDTLVNNIWLSHPYITSGQDPWSYMSAAKKDT